MLDNSLKSVSIPPLTSTEVQVWRIDLNADLPSADELLKFLSDEETHRAARLRQGETRMQFLAGRACLRILLGAALSVEPEFVPFSTGRYGKPEVAPVNGINVHFNVAHSRSTVLIAISLAGPLGIDIEYLDRKTDVLGVARLAFTSREIEHLLALDEAEGRVPHFFEFWTRKEAVIKADGRGLSLPLTQFEIPFDRQEHPSPVDLPGDGDDLGRRYFVSDIALGEDIACAIAVANGPVAYQSYEMTLRAFIPQK